MKKFLSALLALCVVSSSVAVSAQNPSEGSDISAGAEVIVQEKTAEPVVYELTLPEAIEMAYTDNPQLVANEYDRQGKEVSLESAQLQEKAYRHVSLNVATNFDAYCLREGYYLKAAKVQLELSDKEREKIKNQG